MFQSDLKKIYTIFFPVLIVLVFFQNCGPQFRAEPGSTSLESLNGSSIPATEDQVDPAPVPTPTDPAPTLPPVVDTEVPRVELALGIATQYSCRVSVLGNVSCVGSTNQGSTTSLQRVSSLSNVKSISSGGYPICAIQANGRTKCWGSGVGLMNYYTALDVPSLQGAKKISSEISHRCAITSDDRVSCWGSFPTSALGFVADDDNIRVPTIVPSISNAKEISTTSRLSCSIANQDKVMCWGSNQYGLLSLPLGISESLIPIEISGLSGVGAHSLSIGINTACVITAQKNVKCWGENSNGTLGIGNNQYVRGSVQVLGIEGAKSIAVGGSSVCSLLENNSIKCWGNGRNGVLGQIRPVNSLVPIDVVGLPSVGFQKLYAGRESYCVVTNNNQVYCWGENFYGNLGLGPIQTAIHNTPVRAFTVGDL